MKKTLGFLVIAVVFLCSCNSGKQSSGKKVGNGGVVYGGVFRINEVEDFRSLFPHDIKDVVSHRIAQQIYEGLVKLNQRDLTVIPNIAERWEVNSEATSFKFFLHKGVFFHEDACFPDGKGREVKASDIKYCFDLLCTSRQDNELYKLIFKNKVVGAEEYFQSTISKKPLPEGVKGVKVIDDYTLQIDLMYPIGSFLQMLSHNSCYIFPKEAVEKYGVEMRIKCVGTGPFIIKNIKESEAVILERNPKYWKKDANGNQLPFLDAIKVTFLKEKKSELLEFKKGNLDMVFQLPLEMIGSVVGELEEAKKGGNVPFEMQVTPAMTIQYYGFLHKSDIFKNKKVRLAFNYAIDRESLVRYTLQGDAIPAAYGVVPPAFKGGGYQSDSLQGYSFDPAKAKQLLAEAGYPNGNGFPKMRLDLNAGGANNVMVAEVIQKMIKENLNIEIELNVMSFPEHLKQMETGKSDFFRIGWVADYPDPETFLMLLYGKLVPSSLSDISSTNSVRYQNAKYDSLLEMASRTVDVKERYRIYRMAEQLAIDDGALLLIYYDEYTRLLQKTVRNFPSNAMEYRDFSEVYFLDEEEEF